MAIPCMVYTVYSIPLYHVYMPPTYTLHTPYMKPTCNPQPPADIIKDLAPGLKFDENGMPIMPNMGTGFVPGMPGGDASGLPDLGDMAHKMGQGQCTVM